MAYEVFGVGTRDRRNCLGPAGRCSPTQESRCSVCPPAFPSLSLMQRVPVPATRSALDDAAMMPLAGAPKPRIRKMGTTYRCFHTAFIRYSLPVQLEGFGNTEVRAWNAWVCRVRAFIERYGHA